MAKNLNPEHQELLFNEKASLVAFLKALGLGNAGKVLSLVVELEKFS